MNIVNDSHLKKLDRRRVGFTQYTSATPHDNRQTIKGRLYDKQILLEKSKKYKGHTWQIKFTKMYKFWSYKSPPEKE